MPGPRSVEEYMRSLSPDRRAALEELRRLIRAAAPEAPETISYAMPALKSDGRLVVAYAAFKNHISLFPAGALNQKLARELEPYAAGKGTIQFRSGRALPVDLITRVVKARLEENAAIAAARRQRRRRGEPPGAETSPGDA